MTNGTTMTRVGLLHPGEMGSWVGRALRAAGHEVRWVGAGRSTATRRRAEEVDLVEVHDLEELVASSDAVLSICPPAAAEDVAAGVLDVGFRGLYVDANAVAPATVRRIGSAIVAAGGRMVDGSIVGGPTDDARATRLYLSGEQAGDVAGWFTTGRPEPVVVDGAIGAASAVKIGFAGWTKGSAALLLALRAFARAEGVEDAVLDAWKHGLIGVRERSDGVVQSVHRKAWRFGGEMVEIADALEAAGLPDGFHRAAADVYERLADLRDAPTPTDPDVVLHRLRPDT